MAGSFLNINREPDLVRCFDEGNREVPLNRNGSDWSGGGFRFSTVAVQAGLALAIEGGSSVARIHLRWRGDLRDVQRFLGDHWERSYGDLRWGTFEANRPMPWYFLAFDGEATHGYGLMTNPAAFCFWNADPEGISLWIDIRSGGMPVNLSGRELAIGTVVCREGSTDESPFDAATAFCRQMCPNPRLAKQPVYGTNDWPFTYGDNSADIIAEATKIISDLSPNQENRPFSVIDEGWAMGPYNGKFGYGPWVGNPRFGDMGLVASRLRDLNVRPGIWIRPLTPLDETPDAMKLSRDATYLDPTNADVLDHVRLHIKRCVYWGYDLIKHDFTTYDLLGWWGFQMGAQVTRNGWSLQDPTVTNAEALSNLYRVIRDAAGDALLIGCNTVSHLATEYHEIQRTGDDTSGVSWDRTRRMGVNTLAFRAPQHRTFYEVDPDIVAITKSIPWELNEQWLQLVAESGTALFVAVDPSLVGDKEKAALSKALDLASRPQPIGQPIDWMENSCPRQWRLNGRDVEFNWIGEKGSWPYSD